MICDVMKTRSHETSTQNQQNELHSMGAVSIQSVEFLPMAKSHVLLMIGHKASKIKDV